MVRIRDTTNKRLLKRVEARIRFWSLMLNALQGTEQEYLIQSYRRHWIRMYGIFRSLVNSINTMKGDIDYV